MATAFACSTGASQRGLQSMIVLGAPDRFDRGNVIDVVTDLLHLVADMGHDPQFAADMALEHVRNERMEAGLPA